MRSVNFMIRETTTSEKQLPKPKRWRCWRC